MRAQVVYESMYGNTHQIAEAIAAGLGPTTHVAIGSVAEMTPDSVADVDLLVVGGPTHVHGMSRQTSRTAAAEAAEKDDLELELGATGPGLREWFDDLPKSDGAVGAAFDTRIDKPVVFTGSAAKGIGKRLRRHRYRELVDPESFLVEDSEGPLKDGEVERAREWGAALAAQLNDGSSG